MKSKPLISVIVPVYNAEKFLKRCVESVLNQTYSDFELILVDDGSTDQSGLICEEMKLKSNKITVLHKINQGVSSARNKGVDAANGELIAFVDADDWIEKNYLMELVKPILNDEEIDITMSVQIQENIDGEIVRRFPKMDIGYLDLTRALVMLLDNDVWAGAGLHEKIYRKDLFQDYRCNEEFVMGEDFVDNWTLFQKARKIYYTGIENYHYIVNPDSASHTCSPDKHINYVNYLSSLWRIGYKDIRLMNSLRNQLSNNYHTLISKMFFFQGYESKIRAFYTVNHEMLSQIYSEQEKNIYTDMEINRFADYKRNTYDVYMDMIEDMRQWISNDRLLYIYGAGKIATSVSRYFLNNNIRFEGFIVSDNQPQPLLTCDRHRVYRLEELRACDVDNIAVMLAMNRKNVEEVYPLINKWGVKKIFVW